MEVIASAPGKTILFGEHSVVYGEPAIAAAVNKRATIRIKNSKNNKTILRSRDLNFEAELDTKNRKYYLKRGKPGIIRYILEALHMVHDHTPVQIDLSIDIPIGSGLGSSAAVTVATLAALYRYHNIHFNKKTLAEKAHQVEYTVQGEASPLDTLVSTYGGLIYLNRKKQLNRIHSGFNSPFVIGVTSKYGSTSKMVSNVKKLRQKFPKVVNPLIKTMGELTDEAKLAIENGDVNTVAKLMNVNHGLLDALGVNTKELSRMVYIARSAGAMGSKITGAGGGGSIIALCPGRSEQVFKAIGFYDSAFKLRFSRKGVSSKIIRGNSHYNKNLNRKKYDVNKNSYSGNEKSGKNGSNSRNNNSKKRNNKHIRNNPKKNKNKHIKISQRDNKNSNINQGNSLNNNSSLNNAGNLKNENDLTETKIDDNKVIFKKKSFKKINNNKIDYSR